eukprot:7548908-Lingulodinium_polyedra.AAC.1
MTARCRETWMQARLGVHNCPNRARRGADIVAGGLLDLLDEMLSQGNALVALQISGRISAE